MQYRLSDIAAILVAAAAIAVAVVDLVRVDLYSYSLLMVVLAVSMLTVGGWWLSRQAPGTPFREMAIPAAVATVTPLLVGPGGRSFELDIEPVPWLLGAAAAVTLGARLSDFVPPRYRAAALLSAAVLAVVAVPLGMFGPSPAIPGLAALEILAMLLLAGATVVPALLAAVVRHTSTSSGGADRENSMVSLELAVLGLTPAIAIVTLWGRGGSPLDAAPLVVWILVVLGVQFFAVRPLARRASVATTHRDAVVAAMEAERSRIAADIHDDALQELTMLGWRLDASGDRDSAATAREVADRLRAILGDLRLPILDDLGAGPALEWLVERVQRLSGAEVKLERLDPVRPPPEVELAFFRVAQEALSNAVRHGRPPVTVRYWTAPSAASLTVDDSGPASPDPASEGSTQRGFGLLNMAQRAEHIGALLNVRSWPSGGTTVTLEWRV